jgi:hypothetical protein
MAGVDQGVTHRCASLHVSSACAGHTIAVAAIAARSQSRTRL